MNRSKMISDNLPEAKSAVQQSRAPRPLPLFLELVRTVAQTEPELAAKALQGVARYEQALRPAPAEPRPEYFRQASTLVRDCGGSGPPLLLVPSLINPPDILDLDSQTSLADALAAAGRHVFLVDWGEARGRRGLSVSDVVRKLGRIVSAFDEPPAIVGYCLGGTMAIAAANLARAERVATLAAPWHFSAYPDDSRESLRRLWAGAGASAAGLGMLPMEVLQSAFWSLDPKRTVAKFARFADLAPDSDQARRFITLEDWANEGEPLPFPAARELIEEFFGRDQPGSGQWTIDGEANPMTDRLDCPVLHVTASNDRITPAATAPGGNTLQIDSGHVGMVVGSARAKLHAALNDFLAPVPPRR